MHGVSWLLNMIFCGFCYHYYCFFLFEGQKFLLFEGGEGTTCNVNAVSEKRATFYAKGM